MEVRSGRRSSQFRSSAVHPRGPLGRLVPTSPAGLTVLIVAAYFALLLLYLTLQYRLSLLLLVALAVAGVDRLLRLHPEGRFHGLLSTAPYAFVPGLLALGSALLLGQWTSGGLWAVPAALVGALLFAMTANAEYLSVDPESPAFEGARFLLLGVSYLTAFAIFTVVFIAELPLLLGTLFAGIAAALLGVDIVRELAGEGRVLALLAGVIGLVIGQSRLALHYLPLNGLLDGVFLLLTFYVLTGLVQHALGGRLDRGTVISYGIPAVAGAAIIVGANAIG